jgi:hypothetical protein
METKVELLKANWPDSRFNMPPLGALNAIRVAASENGRYQLWKGAYLYGVMWFVWDTVVNEARESYYENSSKRMPHCPAGRWVWE